MNICVTSSVVLIVLPMNFCCKWRVSKMGILKVVNHCLTENMVNVLSFYAIEPRPIRLFHLNSTYPLWKRASKQKFQLNQMLNPAGKICQRTVKFQLKYFEKSLISVPFHLDFMNSIFSLSNSSWMPILNASFYTFLMYFVWIWIICFSKNLCGSGMTNTLILVGIPNSSSEGMWFSNGIAHFVLLKNRFASGNNNPKDFTDVFTMYLRGEFTKKWKYFNCMYIWKKWDTRTWCDG